MHKMHALYQLKREELSSPDASHMLRMLLYHVAFEDM